MLRYTVACLKKINLNHYHSDDRFHMITLVSLGSFVNCVVYPNHFMHPHQLK